MYAQLSRVTAICGGQGGQRDLPALHARTHCLARHLVDSLEVLAYSKLAPEKMPRDCAGRKGRDGLVTAGKDRQNLALGSCKRHSHVCEVTCDVGEQRVEGSVLCGCTKGLALDVDRPSVDLLYDW